MTQEEFRKRYDFNIKTDNIGGGSFGTVYKAYDNVLDREVAIKVSEVKNIGDKEFSLLEEYKAIENLSEHQNIANYEKVYRFESFPTTYDYGIMQYYSLGNLSHYLKNNEVSLEKRESIIKGILEGIAFLHQHNVVHRDLKPSNVLVVDRRGQIIPKITDFGLSKQAESDGKASRFTNSFAGGTLQYSSPEQLKGLPLKLNTDLWSFGTIAYEIITKKTLFEADNQSTASAEWQNTITQKILYADINSRLVGLPIVWQKVVAACLERDVHKRAQSTLILFDFLNGNVKEKFSNSKENFNDVKKLKGRNFRIKISLTPEEIKNGVDKIIKIRRKVKEKGSNLQGIKIIDEKITIPIPAGFDESEHLIIKGKGDDDILEKNAIAGDLIVVINIIKEANSLKDKKSNKNTSTTVKEKNKENPLFKTSVKAKKSKDKATKLGAKDNRKIEKTESKEYYFINSNRMYLARILTFVFSIIIIMLIKYFFFGSSSEPEFIEMQPDYGDELEKDLEYIFEIINYLVFIKFYCLSFILFLIKNVNGIKKFFISIALIIGVFILYIFSAFLTGSLIGIPFLLLLVFLVYNFIFWMRFWMKYNNYKKIKGLVN
jgi:serine/threonine protein kinase